jgi:glycosyltransferase involved in cell wall biosynthesis
LRAWWSGHEDFDFPGTGRILEQAPFAPEVLHLHNLHGDYFDLRELPRLSRAVPTVVTLHDTWLLSGHCAYYLHCQRWKTGCGSCSDLSVYPRVRRDATGYNWRRKREIYRESRLALVSPARWLADRVRESMLLPAATRLEVIANGVDTAVFRPGDREAARARLGWPREAFVVMFAGVSARSSFYKDFETMREAVRLAAQAVGGRAMRFYVVGDTAPPEQLESARIEFLPHRDSMAECYQAADIYLHAAKLDTFPLTVLEALACGLPVAATAVGGIPEQIRDGETGFLVPEGDAQGLARHVARLAGSPELAAAMGSAAVRDAADRFSLTLMVERYRQLYREVVAERGGARGC